MTNKFNEVLHLWLFPVMVGLVYWLFDTCVDYINPPGLVVSFQSAFLPPLHSPEFIFRLSMLIVCIIGGKIFESSMLKLKKIEKALFLSEYAVENTTAFELFWGNEKGEIIKVNKYAAKTLGYTKDELLKKTVFDISTEQTKETWDRLLNVLKKKGLGLYTTKHLRKDGTTIDVVVHLQYLKAFDEHYGFAFVCDATKCPLMEEEGTTPCGRQSVPTLLEFLELAEKRQ